MFDIEKITKNGQNHRKTGENGQFYQNARLNEHARFKTGDFGTLSNYLRIISRF